MAVSVVNHVIPAGGIATPNGRTVIPLNYNSSDADQIVTLLGKFALTFGTNKTVIDFAKELTAHITENNAEEHLCGAVKEFILDKVVYLADPRGAEYVQSPVNLIGQYRKNGFARGDCDDMTLLFASLCNALGLHTRICAVAINGSPVHNHVLNQVMLRGQWNWFDGCNKDNYSKPYADALVVNT